jgi:peptidoglycan/xylan/chitin deacetylase (PgdA/CDA1 family)
MASERPPLGSPDTCLVVSYHYVHDTSAIRFPRLKTLHPAAFDAQVSALERGTAIVDYHAFLEAVDGERPLDAPASLLTFDDGLIDHYRTVFPILLARGLRGTFFISPTSNSPTPRVLNVQKVQLLLAQLGETLLGEVEGAFALTGTGGLLGAAPHSTLYRYDSAGDRRVKQLLNYDLPFEIAGPLLTELLRIHVGDEEDVARELYLTPAMIGEMASAGMIFGYHTRDHRVLSRLSIDEQRDQLAGGVEWIRALTGQSSVPFCYPHGHAHAYTADTIRLLRDTGYSLAFTAVRGVCGPSAGARFEVPRFDTRDVPPVEVEEPAPRSSPMDAAWDGRVGA